MTLHSPMIQVFLPLAVVAVMFAVGATLSFRDIGRVLRHPRGFVLGLLTHALLLPLLAFGIALGLQLPGSVAVGLVLIAACPANVSANIFTHIARGDTMLSVCLTAAATVTSVLTVPLFVNAAIRLFPTGHTGAQVPMLTSAAWLFFVATLPVIAGMLLRQRRPAAARRVERHMGAGGLAVILVVIVCAVWSQKDNVLPALSLAGGPALLLNVLSVSLAWLTAALFGLDRRQRIAVGFECGLQNFATAAFIALTVLGDAPLLLPGIAYGLTMWLSAGGVLLLVRRARAVGAASEPSLPAVAPPR